MKKILALALVLLATGIGATAHASTVCTLQAGDPALSPSNEIMRHADGSWEVQCPKITVKATLPAGATYLFSAGGNTVYDGAQLQQFTLPSQSDYTVNVSTMPDGYTAQTSSDCAGTLTYGDRKECDITFTAPAPASAAPQAPVQQSAPSGGGVFIAPASAPVAQDATSTPETTIVTQDVVSSLNQGTTTTTTTITTPKRAVRATKPIDPTATTTVTVASESAKDAEISSLKDEIRHLIQIILALLQQIATLKLPTL